MAFCRIWFLAFIFSKIQSTIILGNCSITESVLSAIGPINRTIHFCCRNFEEINGKCQACAEGFTSNGTRCHPCDSGQYGSKCAKTCICKNFERCHHVKGCVDLDKSADSSNRTASSAYGILDMNTIIYSTITVVLITVIAILTAYICYGKYKNSNSVQLSRQHLPPAVIHEETERIDFSHDYDEIDERYLSNNLHRRNIDIIAGTEQMTTNEYQVVKTDPENINMEPIDHNLNPYQSRVNDVEVHEYKSIDGIDRKGESDKDSDSRMSSELLIPYKQPIECLDLHQKEYVELQQKQLEVDDGIDIADHPRDSEHYNETEIDLK